MNKDRIASAQRSSRLGESPSGELADIDYVRATGLAAIDHGLGISLWRLKFSDDVRELRNVMIGLSELFVRRFSVDPTESLPDALGHWLTSVCPGCAGRRYLVVPGTPMLSDVECPSCGGTGTPEITASPQTKWLIETIVRLEQAASSSVLRKLQD
jgi:hypothetical protein